MTDPPAMPDLMQQVIVRNTFIDIDDTPLASPLIRSQTEPRGTVGMTFSDSEDDDDSKEDIAPDEPGMIREVTAYDPPGYTPKIFQVESAEDSSYWDSVIGQGPAPRPPYGTGMQQGMMMMVIPVYPGMIPPNQPIQPICVGMGPSQNAPPDSVLVPIYPSAPTPSLVPEGSGGYSQPPQTSAAPPLEAPLAPAPSPLQRSFSVNSKIDRVVWSVDARKLKAGDRVAVSPAFDIPIADTKYPFKMILHPKVVNDGKGGSSFRRSKGHGKVEVKCEAMFEPDTDATVNYRISVRSPDATETHKMQPARPLGGSVRHNFAQNGVSSLPAGEDVWDFAESVDANLTAFVVVLEFMQAGSSNSSTDQYLSPNGQ
mmetsp:Transcript_727/g.1140  ORF Transcript_727/g.1140 Transcript_727/m.1140 type:complete len:370 (+) Transcript_727:52-1161(+)